MTKIDIEYMDTPGDQFVIITTAEGVFRQEDGSIRLWYKPF